MFETTLCEFHREISTAETFEDDLDVYQMLLEAAVIDDDDDDDVIEVAHHEYSDFLLEESVHPALERSRGIAESKRHDRVLVETERSDECGLLRDPLWRDSDVVEPRRQI